MAGHGAGDGPRANLKWTSHMSNIMLRCLVDLIDSGVSTERGFKEVHLNTVGRQVTEATSVEVSGKAVYAHLRKWRARWVNIRKMRELGGALWDDSTNTIVLDDEHYKVHIKDHPTDVQYLNVPLENHDQMAAIFSPPDVVESDDEADLEEVVDGEGSNTGAAEDKGKDSSSVVGAKRKRAMMTEDEAIVFNT